MTYTYTNNDTYQSLTPVPSSDTNAKRKQFEYNGLSELTSVCEITAGTTAFPGGSCAQQNSQTGYWTTYTYDGLGDMTGVTQNAQSSCPPNRIASSSMTCWAV